MNDATIEIPRPKFKIGDRIAPGPGSTIPRTVGTGRIFACNYSTSYSWVYHVAFDDGSLGQMRESRMVLADTGPRTGEEAPDGWQGTPPAEGTRRALIFDAICGYVKDLFDPESEQSWGKEHEDLALELADAIESRLLKETIDEEEKEDGVVDSGKVYAALHPDEPSLPDRFLDWLRGR